MVILVSVTRRGPVVWPAAAPRITAINISDSTIALKAQGALKKLAQPTIGSCFFAWNNVAGMADEATAQFK
jgi:hypothetical protein